MSLPRRCWPVRLSAWLQASERGLKEGSEEASCLLATTASSYDDATSRTWIRMAWLKHSCCHVELFELFTVESCSAPSVSMEKFPVSMLN